MKLTPCIYGLLLLAGFSYGAEESKLVFAASLIRHGDRTPVIEIPKAPYAWKEGLGQLTARGMEQEYELGRKLKKHFIRHSHLLEENYQRTTLYVLSDKDDRTLQSAESLLYGLYPLGSGPTLSYTHYALPQGFQPIPIHGLTEKTKYLFRPSHTDEIKMYDLCKIRLQANKTIQQKLNAAQPLLSKLSTATGMKLNEIKPLLQLGDNLYIRKLHQVPYPRGISAEEAATVVDLTNWLIPQIFRQKTLGRLEANDFLKNLKETMLRVTTLKSKLKYKLYSGHDSNILGVFSALQMPLDKNPPYASELRFELFKKNSSHYYVDTYYNQKAVTIPHCQLHCPFNEFIKLISP